MAETNSSMSSLTSSRENTPRKKSSLKVCSGCHESKPRGAFPKRQWEKKNRRCFFCLSGSVPFSYHPKTNEHIDENSAPGDETVVQNHVATTSRELADTDTETNRPQPPLIPSTPPVATVTTERPEESTEGSIEAEGGHKTGTNSLPATKNRDTVPRRHVSSVENPNESVENQDDTLTEENVADPAVSLEEDIEDLARNWSPPIPETSSPSRAPPPASAPPEPPEGSDRSTSGGSSCREIMLLFASPILDESGSVKSVLAGLFTLFLAGSLIGVASHKNPSLPTEWYQYVSAVIGYVYFLCWSVSFYPQVISNYKRKTTHGLSADFCALNVVGFGCYTTYNASLFWSPAIRELYRKKYGSEVTVQSNDVAFAIHALMLSSVTLAQIAYYRGSQRPSKIIIAVIILVLTLCAVYPILVLYNFFSWLDYLYVLSFVKIGISLIKYVPQVILNHRRKSTQGWSIWNILLDFTGGVLSDLQLVLDCADMGDFSGITGNLAKFGLGSVSIFFDIIFMVQHYVIYPDRTTRVRGGTGRAETEPLLSEEDREEHGEDIV
jgi:cystinosin